MVVKGKEGDHMDWEEEENRLGNVEKGRYRRGAVVGGRDGPKKRGKVK